MSAAAGSAFAAEDWLPAQEELLRGLNHALGNRLASLDAIAMLVDGMERLDEAMHRMLASDVVRLRELLEAYRTLPAGPDARREPARIADLMPTAAALVAHHRECRDLTLGSCTTSAGEEPVRLYTPDALRAAVLLLITLGRGAERAPVVDVTVKGADGWVEVRAARAGATADGIRVTLEHGALERFAAVEGGRVAVDATADGAQLRLTLPGLSRGRTQAA